MGSLIRHRRCLIAGLSLVVSLQIGLPAAAGPPFITDDPEPVDLGHWEVYAFSDGAIDRNDASGLGPAIEVNYGAAPNLQLHVIADLAYAGIFQISNVPPEHIEALVMIDCPFVLFPFARRVIADVTRDGGFPPLMLDPIDFHALYLQNRAQTQAGAA